jgi:sugar-specific transcriptional regulator TrmB
MQRDHIIEKLKSLGFKEYESKVLLALFKGIPLTASQIAKESKVIRTSVYEILKSFVEKGYCNEIETNAIFQYQVIDPEVILDKIEKEHRNFHEQKMSNLKDAFTELSELYKSKKDAHPIKKINIELIRGYNQHRRSKYVEFLKTAKAEILGMYSFKGIVTEETDEAAKNFIKHGGIIRSIYRESLDFKIRKDGVNRPAGINDLIKVCEGFQKYGEELRISKMNIPNMTIVDRGKVFINLDDKSVPRFNQADLIVRFQDFAGYMIDLFNFYWNESLTINEFKKQISKEAQK